MTETPYDFVARFLEENHPDSSQAWENNKVRNNFSKICTPKQKKIVDPNKPKKAKTSFMCFCDVNRSFVKENNPGMKQTDVMREFGRLWSEVKDDDEKTKKYRAMADKDKKRYVAAMKAYVPPVDAAPPVKPKKVKKVKEKVPEYTGPKKPNTAYQLFCRDARPVVKEEVPNASSALITTMVATLWHDIKDGSKGDRYRAIEKENKKKYAIDKKKFDIENPNAPPFVSKGRYKC